MATTCDSVIPTPVSTPSSSPSSDPPAGLLTVPLEIRLQIYSYLLEVPQFSPYGLPSDKPPIAGALLRTNRQINWEATPFLYGRNTFIAHPQMLASFPKLRPSLSPVSAPAAVSRIRRFHLTVYLDHELPYDAKAVTEAFSNADELTLHCVQSMFCGVGYANLRRFEGIRGVRHVTIEGSTTGFEDYVAWLKKLMMSEPESPIDEFTPPEETLADRLSIHYFV